MEDEGSVGGVGSSCVNFIVGITGLSAAVDCKSSGYESVRLLLEEHLAAKEYCFLLNGRAGDEFERFVSFEVLVELL